MWGPVEHPDRLVVSEGRPGGAPCSRKGECLRLFEFLDAAGARRVEELAGISPDGGVELIAVVPLHDPLVLQEDGIAPRAVGVLRLADHDALVEVVVLAGPGVEHCDVAEERHPLGHPFGVDVELDLGALRIE